MAKKKLAYRRVVKDDNNNIRLMYVDANTGQPVGSENIGDYTIIDQGASNIDGELNLSGSKRSDKDTANPNTRKMVDQIIPDKGANDDRTPYNFAGSMERNAQNNYGYIDKNLAVKALGGFGLPGKAIGLAVNGWNLEATNAAREDMGLGPLSRRETASALAFDRDGYVADVKVGGEQYSVGLKAVDKAGRTTLTPKEAARRAAITGTGLKEATPQEREQSIANAKANPDIQEARGGILGDIGRAAKEAVTGGLSGVARSVLSNVNLSGPEGEYTAPVSREVADTPSTVSPAGPGRTVSPARASRTVSPAPVDSPAFGARAASGMQGYEAPAVTSRGLQDVADVTTEGPRFSYNMGPNRPYAPENEIQDVVGKAVNSALGPEYSVSVISGQEGPNNPQYGSNRHKTGLAADVNVYDPNGNRLTMEQNAPELQEVARAAAGLGARGIGFGEQYMGGYGMHIDTVEPGPRQAHTWGEGPLGGRAMRGELVEDMGEHVARERHVSQGMFPSPRPDTVPQGPAQGSFRAAQEEPGLPSFAEQSRRNISSPERGITDTATERAQQRVDARPAGVREAMSYAIAGELGSNTLSNIASGDPDKVSQAKQEIASIASTIDNRAKSTRFADSPSPYSEVLSPSQYNSLMQDNLPVTEANYRQFGDFINDTLSQYDEGVVQSPVPGATHYSANYVNPSWGDSVIGGMVPVGEHKFGTAAIKGTNIPEYAPMDSGFGSNVSTTPDAGGGVIGSRSVNTSSISDFGSGFTSGSAYSGGNDVGGRYSGFSNVGAGSTAAQSTAGVTSENRTGGYDTGRSGRDSFGGFSAGSLEGSASGFGTGLGSAGSSGSRSFSGRNAGRSPGITGGGPGYGSSGDYTDSRDSSRSSASRGGFSGSRGGPSPSSPAGGAQAAAGYGGRDDDDNDRSDSYGGTPGGSGTSPSGPGGAMSGI